MIQEFKTLVTIHELLWISPVTLLCQSCQRVQWIDTYALDGSNWVCSMGWRSWWLQSHTNKPHRCIASCLGIEHPPDIARQFPELVGWLADENGIHLVSERVAYKGGGYVHLEIWRVQYMEYHKWSWFEASLMATHRMIATNRGSRRLWATNLGSRRRQVSRALETIFLNMFYPPELFERTFPTWPNAIKCK